MPIYRSLAIWLLLIVAEVFHGIIRAIILVPWMGEFRSNQIGVFTGSLLVFGITYSTIRWIGAKHRGELLTVGTIWLVLTVAFEILFGRFAVGASWDRILSDYNLVHGGLMPIGLIVLLFSPLITTKLRNVA